MHELFKEPEKKRKDYAMVALHASFSQHLSLKGTRHGDHAQWAAA